LADFYKQDPQMHPFKQQLFQIQASMTKTATNGGKPDSNTPQLSSAVNPLALLQQMAGGTTLKVEDLLAAGAKPSSAIVPPTAAPTATTTPASATPVNIWNTTNVWGSTGSSTKPATPAQPTTGVTPATVASPDNLNPQLQQQYNMLQMNYNMLQLQQAQVLATLALSLFPI